MPWPFERVLVVHHGEIEWNRSGRRQGQLDSPLTTADEQHARAIAGELGRRAAHKRTWRFPDGESYAGAEARARDALHDVAHAGAAPPLLVTHEMVGRMLLRACPFAAPRHGPRAPARPTVTAISWR